MKTDSLVLQNWDDLVFENRNKEYGAYSVRKSYSENVNIAFAVCLMMGAGVFAAYHLHSIFSYTPIIKKDKPIIVITDFIPPIIKQDEQVIKPKVSMPKTINTNLQVNVTAKEVETVIPTNADLLNNVNTVDDPTDGTIVFSEGDPIGEPISVVKTPAVFDHPEVPAYYEGGTKAMMDFISRKIKYPNSARKMGVEGTTYVQFIINAEGKVTDVNIIKGFNAACDAEAARVIALMKDWKAGMQNHVPVSVRMVLPIKFKIAD